MALESMVTVVTGGTGALGGVVVNAFLDAGARVAVPLAREGPNGLPAEVFSAIADVTNPEAVDAFHAAVRRELGTPAILLNLAGGFAGGKTVEETTFQDVQSLFLLNFMGVHLNTRAVLPGMKSAKFGRIVNVAAMAALDPPAKRLAYAVSKRAVITLTEVVARETQGTGVTCNAVAPGTIDTPANRASMPDADRSRWVTPGNIAATLLHLCSEAAREVNGNVFRMGG